MVNAIASIFGTRFATGIAYAITGAAADADTTAIAANDVIVYLEICGEPPPWPNGRS